MKADYILIILGVLIVGMVATQAVGQRPDPEEMVSRNCALFYGPLGEDAEQHCRLEMMQQHSLRSAADPVAGAAP
jgi:hypothetical protein